MSSITVKFEFEIGDFVYYRNAMNDRTHSPFRHIVHERIAQECHGGIQRLYRLDGQEEEIPEVVLRSTPPLFEETASEVLEDAAAVQVFGKKQVDLKRENNQLRRTVEGLVEKLTHIEGLTDQLVSADFKKGKESQ